MRSAVGEISYHSLIDANIHLLEQGIALLARLDDRQYRATDERLYRYGAGSHIRHLLDSYRCFFDGLEAGRVDFDRREREERIEQEREAGMAQMARVIEQLRGIEVTRPLAVRQDSALWTASSTERELQFLLSHTVHHYALIAMILRLQGVEPGEAFGVAPSTLQYWA
jgi:uncharacterized damage-inducible protein DinB